MSALIRQWGRNWHVRYDGESTTTGSFMGCVEWACGALEPGGPPISTSDAQKLIAEVLRRHRIVWSLSGDGRSSCAADGCDWRPDDDHTHVQHVAVEVDKALGGLKREIRGCRGVTTHVRFASGWTVTE